MDCHLERRPDWARSLKQPVSELAEETIQFARSPRQGTDWEALLLATANLGVNALLTYALAPQAWVCS